MILTQDEADTLAAGLPELPDAIRDRLIGDYGLPPATRRSSLKNARRHSLRGVSAGRDRGLVANWMTVELFGA